MNDVEFERLLSFNPDPKEATCLRDLIFDMYLNKCEGDAELANKKVKTYTNAMFKKFVNRKM